LIAKSDLVILVVSATVLAAGVYRWQHNMSMLSTMASARTPEPQSASGSSSDAASAGAATAPDTLIVNGSVGTAEDSLSTRLVPVTSADTQSTAAEASALSGQAGDTGQLQALATARQTVQDPLQNTAQAADHTTLIASSQSSARPSDPLYGSYLVKSGDYLGKIAETFGTTVETLRTINSISGSLINVDQEILYPLPAN
jgi:LysM repeat protein